MKISIAWGNDAHTVVRWTFSGSWTWKDYTAAKQHSDRLLASVDHKVDMICDVRLSPTLNQEFLSAYKSDINTAPSNLDLIVMVGASRLVRSSVEIVMRMSPGKPPGTNFVFADTMEQGYALIAKYQIERQFANSAG